MNMNAKNIKFLDREKMEKRNRRVGFLIRNKMKILSFVLILLMLLIITIYLRFLLVNHLSTLIFVIMLAFLSVATYETLYHRFHTVKIRVFDMEIKVLKRMSIRVSVRHINESSAILKVWGRAVATIDRTESKFFDGYDYAVKAKSIFLFSDVSESVTYLTQYFSLTQETVLMIYSKKDIRYRNPILERNAI